VKWELHHWGSWTGKFLEGYQEMVHAIRCENLLYSPTSTGHSVMIGSPGDREALEAGRLGLSHWAGPSVTGSAREVSSWNGGIMVDILAKGK